MKNNIISLKRSSWIFVFTIIISLLISVFFFFLNFPGIRKSFIYKASDSDVLRIEHKYIPLGRESERIVTYVNELLLGPVSEHCIPVFEKGTKLLSCFKRNGILYVDISEDALKGNAVSTDFRQQIALFKKNVQRNFPTLKEIELFIEGKSLFDGEWTAYLPSKALTNYGS